MSYDTPYSYSQLAPKLGIPSTLVSDDLLAFKGSRGVIRQIPASTGSSVGPSSTCLFQIPQESLAFIKPSSMYIQLKCVVAQAGVLNTSWAFAGQNGTTALPAAAGANPSVGCGGASSLFSRMTITFPGGASMSYAAQNHWRNSILPHALSDEFIQVDLRQLEHAGVARVNVAANTAASKTAYCCIPVDLPIFNAQQAFPLLLCSGGVTLECVTASVIEAFATATTAITDFSLSEMSLVFETIQVSPEYKQALMQSSIERPFSLAVRDRVYLGGMGVSGSNRVNLGVGLSSLKGVVGTFAVATDWDASTDLKCYKNNGLTSWNLYVNGMQVSPNSITNDAACYAELQRALSNLNDSNITSSMIVVNGAESSAVRNNYTTGQFAFGCSTEAFSDSAFSLCGIPADTLSVETICGTITAEAWQNTTAAAAATMHLWALYDSVLSVQADGSCLIRK